DDAAAVARRRAALLAEEDRVAQIRAIDRIDSAIVKAAIAQGWTVEKAKAASFDLNAVRDARPTFNGSFAIHSHGPESMQPRVVEAAFAIAGKLKDIEKHYDVRTLEAAHQQYRGKASIQEVLLEAAAKNGHQVRPSQVTADLKNVLKAAFSTNSLPGILSNVANKQIAAGFMAVESTWRRISYVRPVNDFKTVTSHRLTGDLKYQQVAPDGELKHGKLGEESFENKANTYGRILSLTRTDIVNDDLGALTKVPQMLGRGAALAINDIFWREFLEHADFFKTANKNYITGAGTVLSIDGLTQLETAFLDQVDDNGDPLAIDPKILLVPNALKATADQLMTSTQIVYGGETAKGANNPHAGKFTVEKSSYLNNPNFAGGSATAYYLLADPQEIAAIEVVFLNGREEPIVESADADFNVLGIDMRGYHDFGVKKQDHRGAAKSKGAA
ncbi:MAG TPA: Mu-like prophage major head subunit gpT family protein, partial [Pirellulales bacterium]